MYRLFSIKRFFKKQQFETAFQHVPDRFPEFSGAFHRHVRAGRGRQPVRQPQQLRGGGAKGLGQFDLVPLAIHTQPTGHHRLLMHIQPGAMRIQNFHGSPPEQAVWLEDDPLGKESQWRAHPLQGATVWGAFRSSGQPATRAHGTRMGRPYNQPLAKDTPHFHPCG